MSEKLKVARRGLEGILRLWGRCLGCLEGVQKVYRVSGRYLEAAVNTWANIAWKNRTWVRCLKTCLFSDILSIGQTNFLPDDCNPPFLVEIFYF